jgi:uncharacterized membrane protein YkvA (DUF1232 family)
MRAPAAFIVGYPCNPADLILNSIPVIGLLDDPIVLPKVHNPYGVDKTQVVTNHIYVLQYKNTESESEASINLMPAFFVAFLSLFHISFFSRRLCVAG